jgi:hypothetical protein
MRGYETVSTKLLIALRMKVHDSIINPHMFWSSKKKGFRQDDSTDMLDRYSRGMAAIMNDENFKELVECFSLKSCYLKTVSQPRHWVRDEYHTKKKGKSG